MGQPITVVEKPSSANPAILRLETNRPLSGMAHERYTEPPGELMQRPVDELARRLFAKGGIEGVHINGSVVTVTLRGGRTGEGLGDVVRELFLHYGETPTDTVAVPLSDADAAPDALADSGDAPSAQASADDAPAPERPAPEAEAADQQVEGIPNAELAPEDSAVSEREPSPADPADLDAARASVAPGEPSAPGTNAAGGEVPEAGDGGPVVEEGPTGTGAGRRADAPEERASTPTPDADRPDPEPLEADPGEVAHGDATVPDPDAGTGDDDTTSS